MGLSKREILDIMVAPKKHQKLIQQKDNPARRDRRNQEARLRQIEEEQQLILKNEALKLQILESQRAIQAAKEEQNQTMARFSVLEAEIAELEGRANGGYASKG